MTSEGMRQPRACESAVLKARERKRRLQVSMRVAFRDLISVGERTAGGFSKASL